MRYNQLGHSGLNVSQICLGSMTWGEQNSQQEAFEQLDLATDAGVNFVDTAEIYPVPPCQATQGESERFLGKWLKKTGLRDKIIIATKVSGPGEFVAYLRNGPRLDANNINKAVEQSLKRLQTDYIDLYQTHWPDRPTNFFGQLGYKHSNKDQWIAIEDTLETLDKLIDAGKIRHIGISNETPWGTMKYLQTASTRQLPRVVSIQNPYNLLNRSFEIGLAEIAHREKIGLLAYSPLGFGTLCGKYLGGKQPEKARLTRFSRFTRYSNSEAVNATQCYVDLAIENSLDPGQMALAFINSRSFLTSTIIGATTLKQLKSNLESSKIQLSKQLLGEIEKLHSRFPNPGP